MKKILFVIGYVATQALAAPFGVQLGDARIAIDTPAGFSDVTFTGSPRLSELAESLTSPSNKVLLFALSDADLRRFTQGDPLQLQRYLLVAIPKSLERDRTDSRQFAELVGDSVLPFGKPQQGDPLELLQAQPPAKPMLLDELRREPDLAAVLLGTRLPQNRGEPQQYMLSTSTWVLLRGKPLNLSVFTLYQDQADAAWIRAVTLRWADELRRLNGR